MEEGYEAKNGRAVEPRRTSREGRDMRIERETAHRAHRAVRAVVAAVVLPVLLAAAPGSGQEGPPAQVVSAAGDKFRFQGGEYINVIQMNDYKSLRIRQLVTADGSAGTLYGGTVNLKGKSLEEARQIFLEDVIRHTGLRNPKISLVVEELQEQRIYVGGAVRNPMAVVIPRGYAFTLDMAIASVHGYSEDADASRVRITRQTESGKRKTIVVNALRFNRNENGNGKKDKKGKETEAEAPTLKAGDMVFVPRDERYLLLGRVAKPGLYSRHQFAADPTGQVRISQLLYGSGGLQPGADLRRVRLYRVNPNGTNRVLTLNVEHLVRNGPDPADIFLKNGDTILVPTVDGVTVLGAVARSGVYYRPAGVSFTIARVIAMAGGFTEAAKTRAVLLVRADNPGKPIKIDLDEITRKGRTDLDLSLQPGDMIYVGERLF